MASTVELIRKVKSEIEELTGFPADSVSEFAKTEDGWEVMVNVLELKRIPPSTDMLAAYKITLSPGGNVTSYHRIRRYLRDQVMEEQP